MQATQEQRSHWLDRRLFSLPGVNLEVLLYTIIILLTIFSRLYILGARVMSHDENSHVYYSWRFYRGEGFQHDPLMHGPLQFHLLAASYFIFGDNDFTGRFPQALCSIAAVAFMWAFRRYLGRVGALIGAVMMAISPYVMFYGRYARNEGFIELFFVVTIWALLRYLETGLPRYLYWLTLASVLHFTSKETSFIYHAQAMLFLGIYFLYRVIQARWPHPRYRDYFLVTLIAVLLLTGAAGGFMVFAPKAPVVAADSWRRRRHGCAAPNRSRRPVAGFAGFAAPDRGRRDGDVIFPLSRPDFAGPAHATARLALWFCSQPWSCPNWLPFRCA